MVQRKRKEKLTAQERRRKAALKGWKTRRANQRQAEKYAREERLAIKIESKSSKVSKKTKRLNELEIERRVLVIQNMLYKFPDANEKTISNNTKIMTQDQMVIAILGSKKKIQREARNKENEVDGVNPFWYH